MTKKLPVEKCDCDVIHEQVVTQVKSIMLTEENYYHLAVLFKLLSDSTRIRILWALEEADLCVCDIAYLLNMTQSAISHQLRVLKQAKLVKSRRAGKIIFYSIADQQAQQILKQGLQQISAAKEDS